MIEREGDGDGRGGVQRRRKGMKRGREDGGEGGEGGGGEDSLTANNGERPSRAGTGFWPQRRYCIRCSELMECYITSVL